MRRRSFLRLLAGLTAPASLAALAQPGAKLVAVLMHGGVYRVGFDGLKQTLEAETAANSIRLVLKEGDGDMNALKTAAAEFEKSGADLLVTFATTVSLAAKDATQRVPIVFIAGSDPVKYGLVESISKPGGRLTGVASFRTEITPKRFALMKEMIPGLKRVMTFYNPSSPLSVSAGLDNARLAAEALGIELVLREVRSAADTRKALHAMQPGDADAFFFPNDAIVLSQSRAIIERATALGMPTMAQNTAVVADGALAGYGLDYREEGRLAARYVWRILAGTNPSDLPVEIGERHALSINLRTAKVLGLTIPPTLLARADEVIE
jgi:putative tryptophan/tyrosine transport system substrate-binding protein